MPAGFKEYIPAEAAPISSSGGRKSKVCPGRKQGRETTTLSPVRESYFKEYLSISLGSKHTIIISAVLHKSRTLSSSVESSKMLEFKIFLPLFQTENSTLPFLGLILGKRILVTSAFSSASIIPNIDPAGYLLISTTLYPSKKLIYYPKYIDLFRQ